MVLEKSKGAKEQGSKGAKEQGSKGAREQGNKGAREQGNKEVRSKRQNLLNSPDFQVGMREGLDPVFNGLDFFQEAGSLCGDLLVEGHDGFDFLWGALVVLGIGEEILADHLAVVPLT